MFEFYKPNNIKYSANGDVTLCPTVALFTPTINETWELEITQPFDKEGRWKVVCEDGVIKCEIPEHDGFEIFYIYDYDKGLNGINIKARQIFYEEADTIVQDIRPTNKTGQQALNELLLKTNYIPHSDILTTNTCYFTKTNIVEAINGGEDNTFISRWGGEIWHNKYDLYINNRIGQDRGIRIEYGKDLVNVDLKINMENVITRAYPWAENDIRLRETYIDSPNKNKYRKMHERYIDMSDLKLKENPDDEEGYNTVEEIWVVMRERVAQMWKDGVDVPTVEGTVEVAALENTNEYKYIKQLIKIRLGDDVSIYHRDIDINMKARCVSYVYNLLTKKFESITIGQVQPSFWQKQADITNRVESAIDKNGNTIAANVKGWMDAYNTGLKASIDTAKKLETTAFKLEVDDISNPKNGCVIGSSTGVYCASNKDQYGNWKFNNAITGKGILADAIYAGTISSQNGKSKFELNTGNFTFGETMEIENTGEVYFYLNNKKTKDDCWFINGNGLIRWTPKWGWHVPWFWETYQICVPAGGSYVMNLHEDITKCSQIFSHISYNYQEINESYSSLHDVGCSVSLDVNRKKATIYSYLQYYVGNDLKTGGTVTCTLTIYGSGQVV